MGPRPTAVGDKNRPLFESAKQAMEAQDLEKLKRLGESVKTRMDRGDINQTPGQLLLDCIKLCEGGDWQKAKDLITQSLAQ